MPEIKTRMGKGLIAELDKVARDSEITRSEAIRMALRLGIDQLGETENEAEDTDTAEIETCDECQAEIPSDALFCPACGIEFEKGTDESEETTEGGKEKE